MTSCLASLHFMTSDDVKAGGRHYFPGPPSTYQHGPTELLLTDQEPLDEMNGQIRLDSLNPDNDRGPLIDTYGNDLRVIC
jgi:hypothetical protein